MRISVSMHGALVAGAALLAAPAAQAQGSPAVRTGGRAVIAPRFGAIRFAPQRRAIIGVSTTSGARARDTLGVLVTSVRSDSPAEKAGLLEGNRIASVNGVNLRLLPADVGDDQMAGIMSHRLSREIDKLRPGDEVELHVVADGQTRSLTIKTVAPEDLEDWRVFPSRSPNRTTLGVGLAVTGSRRDTLGVFVLSVNDDGPAARAGIEEGARIASINGVDVRARRGDDDEDYAVLRSSPVSRLEREIARAEPGDQVKLRVYANGQYRDVTVTAARASDLPRHEQSITIIRGGDLPVSVSTAPMVIDAQAAVDRVRDAMQSMSVRSFGTLGRRVDW